MEKYISQFITLNAEHTVHAVATKNQYEGNIIAVCNGNRYFVLVENTDWSRQEDIDELIFTEFAADVKGWYVLKKFQKAVGEVVAFDKGFEYERQITFQEGSYHCWLLKVKPHIGSRLFNEV